MIEIERKFRLNTEQKGAIEQELGAHYGSLETVHQVDQVFLHGVDSFAGFTRGDPVVRLRTTNDVTTLAYKRSINEAGDTVEHELTVESAATMAEILKEMDYRPVTTVIKDRTIAKAGEMAIMLDSVVGAGHFLEIEILAADESTQPVAERQIMDKAAEFGLTEADIELRKYDQLVSMPNGQ
ncbi:MAG: class IV adenylate cyclase [Candidatus Saccharimonadales bacterium]